MDQREGRRATNHDVGGARGRASRGLASGAAAGCLASVLVLGGATLGGSRASAGDPLDAERAVEVVETFEPDAPILGVATPPEARTVAGDKVAARLVGEGAERSIEVAFVNPSRSDRRVRCEVALDRITVADVEPMARMMPPPQITRVYTHEVDASIAAGEERTISARVPAAALGSGASGRLRLAILAER